ncbi:MULTISPECIES: hypothetical protein [Laceyella]|uniref:Uncharacterized protein n=1 Tax=Laceyella sacchari TaxID=37482 RepID=A0ABY5U2C9_LACSH|nr:hypothetical protein [Laceyella sacchari]MRG29795.1 hypothetical protein [Laceyella tengchongensis]UWE03683.1 hypothetical protein NYR52_00170 [Laceyella sacchari]
MKVDVQKTLGAVAYACVLVNIDPKKSKEILNCVSEMLINETLIISDGRFVWLYEQLKKAATTTKIVAHS